MEGPKGNVGIRYQQDKVSFIPQHAGEYLLRSPGAPPIARIAVNYIPEESDVRVSKSLMQIASEIDPDRFIQKAILGPWLLWGGLLFFVLQALLSFFTRASQEDGHV